jgi:hypothetical protein
MEREHMFGELRIKHQFGSINTHRPNWIVIRLACETANRTGQVSVAEEVN